MRAFPFQSVFAIALLGAAVGVRAIPPIEPVAPALAPGEELAVAQPIQLLRMGGFRRMTELDEFVAEPHRQEFTEQRRALANLPGCPELYDWLATSRGQRLERLVAELTGGSNEEGLAALGLVFQLARRTRWEPGLIGGTQSANRLGELLREWLARRGEAGVQSPLLEEPALAAYLIWGKAMQRAFDGSFFGGENETVLERAQSFARGLVGEPGRPPTEFGIGLARRYPGALGDFTGDTFLRRLADETRQWFPDLKGSCDG